jgi:regulator of sirC expression with transglutaminase-like and TPR domain
MSLTPPAEPSATDITPEDYVWRLGQAGEGPHDIAVAAVMLAAFDHPEKKLTPFTAHLAALADEARGEAAFVRDAENGARALASVLAVRHLYEGERLHYDDPANADLMQVIERRRGLPVALGILYIHAARAAGMEACGLFSPGHFLLKVRVKGSEAIVDAFNGGALVDRERLTATALGGPPHLALGSGPDEPGPQESVSDTEVLLRLLNNRKVQGLRRRDTENAGEILRRMTMVAPRRPDLWLEMGRLREHAGALSAARAAYERCLASSRAGAPVHNEAALALQALKRRLN